MRTIRVHWTETVVYCAAFEIEPGVDLADHKAIEALIASDEGLNFSDASLEVRNRSIDRIEELS